MSFMPSTAPRRPSLLKNNLPRNFSEEQVAEKNVRQGIAAHSFSCSWKWKHLNEIQPLKWQLGNLVVFFLFQHNTTAFSRRVWVCEGEALQAYLYIYELLWLNPRSLTAAVSTPHNSRMNLFSEHACVCAALLRCCLWTSGPTWWETFQTGRCMFWLFWTPVAGGPGWRETSHRFQSRCNAPRIQSRR